MAPRRLYGCGPIWAMFVDANRILRPSLFKSATRCERDEKPMSDSLRRIAAAGLVAALSGLTATARAQYAYPYPYGVVAPPSRGRRASRASRGLSLSFRRPPFLLVRFRLERARVVLVWICFPLGLRLGRRLWLERLGARGIWRSGWILRTRRRSLPSLVAAAPGFGFSLDHGAALVR